MTFRIKDYKNVKIAIFAQELPFYGPKTAKIFKNLPTGGFTVNTYTIWIRIMHFCGKSEFP